MSVSGSEFIKDIAPIIAKPLPIKTHAHLLSVSKYFKDIFTPSFNVRKALTFIIEGNINGCDLIQQPHKPSEETRKHIQRNRYIVTLEGLFYFDCKTQQLEELLFLEGKSLELLTKKLTFKGITVAKKKDQNLITTYTGHVYNDDFINLIESDPTLLFKKYPCTEGFLGQQFFNFSPYLLMAFRGEDDMLTTIMSLEKVTTALKNDKKLQTLFKEQYAEILCGGADFVKIDRDPYEIIDKNFEGLIQYKDTYTVSLDRREALTFLLLGNPDGIFCHHKKEHDNHEFHFFYVNKESKTIKPLHEIFNKDNPAFEKFKASIAAMEMNTSRRLSEDEHHVIKEALDITLVHKGLFYADKGVLFRDSCAPFFLIENAYRKYIRLSSEADEEEDEEERQNCSSIADKSWQEDVSPEQLKIAWVWQRLCEQYKPFYPFNIENFSDFRRGRWVQNQNTFKHETIFEKGVIKVTERGVYKGVTPCCSDRALGIVPRDLIALHWLIKNAKAKVLECKPPMELEIDCTTTQFKFGS